MHLLLGMERHFDNMSGGMSSSRPVFEEKVDNGLIFLVFKPLPGCRWLHADGETKEDIPATYSSLLRFAYLLWNNDRLNLQFKKPNTSFLSLIWSSLRRFSLIQRQPKMLTKSMSGVSAHQSPNECRPAY